MASKKNKLKRNIIILAVALLVVGVLYYTSGQQFGLDGGAGGATIFSVDSVEVQGQGETETNWVLGLSMNDGAESAYGMITQDDVERFNLESVPASEFEINFELRNPSCRYGIMQDTRNTVGEMYYTFVTEQCLANVCPYEEISLNDVISHCQEGGGSGQIPAVSGEDCDRMVDLLQLDGSYTEWCYWLPEESNKEHDDECRDMTLEREITVTNNPAGCGKIKETTRTVTTKVSEGETGGDWQVMSAGIVPQYDLYRISSATQFGYEAVVTVTMKETGESFECVIDPVTKSCELGDFGSVKFAGNLVADKSCPDPGNDIQLLRDIDTKEWTDIDAGIGSSLASYLTSMNKIKEMNIDYYTFTAVPTDEVDITSKTIQEFSCDPAVGNPVFSEITAMNGLYDKIPDEEPLFDYNCEVQNNNIYSCDSGSSAVYPLLKLTVKASKVGIFVPEGQPEIQGVSLFKEKAFDPDATLENVEFEPNRLTKMYVGVKNIGSEDDSFDISLDCPFPISQQSVRVAVESQDSAIAELVVSGTGVMQECELRATSIGYPENRDQEDVKVVINPECDQLGITPEEKLYTEFGCFAQENYPETPCNNNEFWLSALERCIPYEDMATGEERLSILEEVAERDCSRQCNGNKDCIVECLNRGNVKPVCVGEMQMMTLNDYLCDFQNQPNLVIPTAKKDKIWLGVPYCQYVCEYGKTGEDCQEFMQDSQFSYDQRPIKADLLDSDEVCESCFDGVQNQDEEGIDCGGICAEKYPDKVCGKLRSPDHCYNHVKDGDEEGIDCGGSCDFECREETETPQQEESSIGNGMYYLIGGIVGGLLLIIVIIRYRRGI